MNFTVLCSKEHVFVQSIFSPWILPLKFASYCQDQSYKNSLLLIGSEQVTCSKSQHARWWSWRFVSNHCGQTETKHTSSSVATLLDGWPSRLCWIFWKFLPRAVHLVTTHPLWCTPDCTMLPSAPFLKAIIAAIWWQLWNWLNRSPVQCAALCHLATEFALLSWCCCRLQSTHACGECSNKTHREAGDSCVLISVASSWSAKVE